MPSKKRKTKCTKFPWNFYKTSIYYSILSQRLTKWLRIPEQQTGYQKRKGCFHHVFFVRCLISIIKKNKSELFIGITDFVAAFDRVSRRLLFKKLILIGMNSFMLNALKNLYENTAAYIEIEKEYSEEFSLMAGVLQGASSSTALFPPCRPPLCAA